MEDYVLNEGGLRPCVTGTETVDTLFVTVVFETTIVDRDEQVRHGPTPRNYRDCFPRDRSH